MPTVDELMKNDGRWCLSRHRQSEHDMNDVADQETWTWLRRSGFDDADVIMLRALIRAAVNDSEDGSVMRLALERLYRKLNVQVNLGLTQGFGSHEITPSSDLAEAARETYETNEKGTG